MNQDICLHAINAYYKIYYPKLNINSLQYILKNNALLSRRMLGLYTSVGFNGIDYISLCDYQKRNLYPIDNPQYNSYESYIRESLSIIFPKDKLELITPSIIDICMATKKNYQRMAYLGMSEEKRYSDLYDEVQVKNKISLDLMCGLTIPLSKMDSILLNVDKNTQKIIKHLNELKELLIKYNHNVPIYDIDTMLELKTEEDVKELVKYYTKKI